jgi:hypothetical protein
MAKASAKDTPNTLPLDQALKRVVKVELSEDLAKRNLVKALIAERMRGRAGYLIVGRIKTRELLDQDLPGHAWDWPTKIDFANNQSMRPGKDEDQADRSQAIRFEAFRLTVYLDDLMKAWPDPAKAAVLNRKAEHVAELMAEVAKVEGADGMTPTKLATEVAFRTGAKMESVRNRLYEFGIVGPGKPKKAPKIK